MKFINIDENIFRLHDLIFARKQGVTNIYHFKFEGNIDLYISFPTFELMFFFCEFIRDQQKLFDFDHEFLSLYSANISDHLYKPHGPYAFVKIENNLSQMEKWEKSKENPEATNDQ